MGSNLFDSGHFLPVIWTDACNYSQQRIHNIVIASQVTLETISALSRNEGRRGEYVRFHSRFSRPTKKLNIIAQGISKQTVFFCPQCSHQFAKLSGYNVQTSTNSLQLISEI